jgi:hypothetical protein
MIKKSFFKKYLKFRMDNLVVKQAQWTTQDWELLEVASV